MSDPTREFFATPGEASRRGDALSDRWNALQNQAMGPGTKPRKDVPEKLQKQIMADRKRFRSFIRRPTFGTYGAYVPRDLLTTDYETLVRWYKKYRLRAQQLRDALPGGEALSKQARPKKLPEYVPPGPYALAIGGRLAAAAAVVAVVLSTAALLRSSRR